MASRQKKAVAPIVPGQEVFSPEQMRQLLGGMGQTTYYALLKAGHLKFSRVDKGKMVRHTIDQYRDFIAYLNTEGQVSTNSEIDDWKSRKANAAARR